MRTIFTTRQDLENFGRDLESKLYEAMIFIENGDGYDEQREREDSLIGHLPETVRQGVEDWLEAVVEWKEAPVP